MQRREMMQAMVAAAATGLLPPTAQAEAGTANQHPFPINASRTPRVLADISRDALSVKLLSDATVIVSDKQSSAEWRFGPVAFQEVGPVDEGLVWLRTARIVSEQYPGRFLGQAEGSGYRFWVLDGEGQSRGSFHAELAVEGNALEWSILQIDASLPSLSFPTPLACESMVLPQHAGRWIRTPMKTRFCWPFFSDMNMRWFGGLQGLNGYLAILPGQQCADAVISATEMSAAPLWLQRRDKWSGGRKIRYEFLRGNYVALAKAFRAWAQANGLHRSLTAKLRETPALSALTTGRLISIMQAEPAEDPQYYQDRLTTPPTPNPASQFRIHLTHSQTAQVLRELPAAGVPRALVVLRGWIRGGYDWSHPDIWPPDERLGSVEELRALCSARGPLTVALHDNYQDSYRHNPSWPHGVDRTREQRPLRGGYWDGGQAYILNSAAGVEYAQRNWKMIQQLGPRAMFIDTVTAPQTYQSYDPARLQFRAEDIAGRVRLLEFFRKQGNVVGSEEGADFGVPAVAWFENRHVRRAGETVPLWSLVFHDAVVNVRYTGDTTRIATAGDTGKEYPAWLLEMLWGYAALSGLRSFEERDNAYKGMRATRQVDAWFALIATDSMDDHAFLSSDETLERTQFSSGRSIVVNFAPEPQTYAGRTVPPGGFTAYDEHGEVLVL